MGNHPLLLVVLILDAWVLLSWFLRRVNWHRNSADKKCACLVYERLKGLCAEKSVFTKAYLWKRNRRPTLMSLISTLWNISQTIWHQEHLSDCWRSVSFVLLLPGLLPSLGTPLYLFHLRKIDSLGIGHDSLFWQEMIIRLPNEFARVNQGDILIIDVPKIHQQYQCHLGPSMSHL